MCNRFKKMLVPIAKWFLLLCLLNCSIEGLLGVSASVTQRIHVVTADDSEPIVLDCDFEANKDESQLVVKWFKDDKAIYQWIKGHKPTVYPQTRGLIDEDFDGSSDYNNHQHGSIAFPVPTKDLTGLYKCLVEMSNTTYSMKIDLHVIDISHSDIQLHSSTQSNDTLVTCSVENVYPEPKIVLWTNDDITLAKVFERAGAQNNGFYNATAVVSANVIDANEEIGCTLQFPGVEFNITKIFKSSASMKQYTVFGIIVMLLFVLPA